MNFNHRIFLSLGSTLCGCALTVGASSAATVTQTTARSPSAGIAHKVPTDAPNLPHLSVAQIVERNVAARGGAPAWEAIKAISYTGTLDAGKVRPDNGMHVSSTERLLDKPGKPTKIAQSPDQKPIANDAGTPITLPYTLTMQRPNKQRVEVKFKDQMLVQVYDGQSGWKLQPYLNRGGAVAFTGEEMIKARQFQEIDGPLIGYAAKGTQISLDGTDRVDGRPAYRLKLLLKGGAMRHVWVDAETFLDVQIDGSRRFNGRQVAEYTAMRDFRRVGGVQLPYLMETRTEGVPDREKIVVDKVVLNPAIDASLFAKPT